MKKIFLSAALISLCCILTAVCTGCSAGISWNDYVSEYRSNIYEGSNENYDIFASFSVREYPYESDGYVGNLSTLFEVALSAPDNTKTYDITFSIGGKDYGGELSFDSVRMVHTFSQTLPEPEEQSISFLIGNAEDADEEAIEITANSIKNSETLGLYSLLNKAQENQKERFGAYIDGNSFKGEIYVRLLHENDCYYYIGLIDRNGNIFSMLADAETGEIVATREQ